ncbi:MAG: hypothetical protein KGI33_04995 [Thaumarchaeota archaeon]|nr:hypothetical protein [Nitrososphaerota archaeon]
MTIPRKSIAAIPAVVLVIALAAHMPNMASAQGGCAVNGTGTAFGPISEKIASINRTNGVRITYQVQTDCLDKSAEVNDTVNAVFDVNATCNDSTAPGACATLANLGTIGNYTQAAKTCNSNGSCTVGPVIANSNATIPADGTPVEILSGSASLVSLPHHGRMVVAHLGQVPIITPAGFTKLHMKPFGDDRFGGGAPDFNIGFMLPKPIHIPGPACTAISNVLTKAGISQTLIQQILSQLGCS